MLKRLLQKVFGTINDRHLRSFEKIVSKINDLEKDFIPLTDKELKEYTEILQNKLANGSSLDDILPEAFALVREASKRVLGLRHYDVQLMGGIALHKGMISEMKTGEGKTLVATLPAYLNALTKKGVHIITVNDYLANRDTEWVGQIYKFLGLSVGCIISGVSDEERKEAYNCDITHCTNNELGFDYLRDNMKYSLQHVAQRPFNYAIIDEVDSILIDEARTPLIISGPTEDNSELYYKIDKIIPKLKKDDYDIDEKSRTVGLNDNGINHIEKLLTETKLISPNSSLYDIENVNIIHHVNQALKAHKLFNKNVDYMVKDNQVLIVDEFTGRIMEGRRFSEGLHQALEAKESVPIQNENQTLASITFQNYFRLYPKLSGMTGTAMTEANEFRDIYNLEVVSIPTNNPITRIDEEDEIYRTAQEKYDAIIKEIEKSHKKQQPILVGTVSIEKSEYLSSMLKKKGIKHNVLNAKYHEQEAHIIAQAGRPGAVTIATNMAGRGTDIMLGGNPDMLIKDLAITNQEAISKESKKIKEKVNQDKKSVIEAGGLLVIGTERHESRRIDNQLRGRSGRMGDPGRTKFYLSLEDDLMRIFASQKISNLLKTLGLKDGESIFHPMISRTIEKAQQKVEARNYDIRKNLLRFDDVMNDQRKIIYEQRLEIMSSSEVHDIVTDMYTQLNNDLAEHFIPEKTYKENWDIEGLKKKLHYIYNSDCEIDSLLNSDNFESKHLVAHLDSFIEQLLENKKEKFGEEIFKLAEQRILLMTVDQLWKDHLLSLDHLRQGIYLRAYGQRDPLNEYKKEAFTRFSDLLTNLRELYITRLSHMSIDTEHNKPESMLSNNFEPKLTSYKSRVDPALLEKSAEVTKWAKVGRNEACPCGSGKKFKHCHGKLN
jgi:preprotein translocase subunit SecA